MLSIVKTISAFILGCIVLLFFYYFVSLPVIPCITVYIVGATLSDKKFSRFRMVSVIVFGAMAIFLYGIDTLGMIKYYPEYGNLLAIIFAFLTIFSFFGATIVSVVLTRIALVNKKPIESKD